MFCHVILLFSLYLVIFPVLCYFPCGLERRSLYAWCISMNLSSITLNREAHESGPYSFYFHKENYSWIKYHQHTNCFQCSPINKCQILSFETIYSQNIHNLQWTLIFEKLLWGFKKTFLRDTLHIMTCSIMCLNICQKVAVWLNIKVFVFYWT